MRLKLADLLVKPMQRVTKYGLLLKNALSKTVSEEDRSALENMVYIYIYRYCRVTVLIAISSHQQLF